MSIRKKRDYSNTFTKTVTTKGKAYVYWVARLDYPANPVTGERPKSRDFTAKTRDEAVDKRRAEYDKWEQNPQADTSNTFGAYLLNEFIAHEEARTRLSDAFETDRLSWARYEQRASRIRKLVASKDAEAVCSTPLADLMPFHLVDYLKAQRLRLSPSKFNKVRQDLKLAIENLDGRTRADVFTFAPRFPRPAKECRAEKKLYDPDSLFEKLEDEQYSLEYRAFAAFALTMQCRPQEMVVLEWADINYNTAKVEINKRLCQVESKTEGRKTHYEVRPGTKTGDKGVRSIDLSDWGPMMPMLRDLQRERMARGSVSSYVFPHRDGTLLTKMRLRRLWVAIQEALELEPGVKFYTLKTLGNSHALANGASLAAQAEKLGHTTTVMAATSYRVVTDQEREARRNAFNRRSAVNG